MEPSVSRLGCVEVGFIGLWSVMMRLCDAVDASSLRR
jgi:hypothetical protein